MDAPRAPTAPSPAAHACTPKIVECANAQYSCSIGEHSIVCREQQRVTPGVRRDPAAARERRTRNVRGDVHIRVAAERFQVKVYGSDIHSGHLHANLIILVLAFRDEAARCAIVRKWQCDRDALAQVILVVAAAVPLPSLTACLSCCLAALLVRMLVPTPSAQREGEVNGRERNVAARKGTAGWWIHRYIARSEKANARRCGERSASRDAATHLEPCG